MCVYTLAHDLCVHIDSMLLITDCFQAKNPLEVKRKLKFTKQERECLSVIQAFVRGGLPGQNRLNEVLPNIFKHYKVRDFDKQSDMLLDSELEPFYDTKRKRMSVRIKVYYED